MFPGNTKLNIMNVALRQRKKRDKISLYLDYYHKGNRSYEYLSLYLYPAPEKGKLTKLQKDHNKNNLELAENIRAKKHLEIQSGVYGFPNKSKLNASFLDYFQMLTNKRKESTGNYGNWDSTIKHLKSHAINGITFAELDKQWLEGFKDYLHTAKTKSEKNLSQNSQHSYFNKVKAALKQARRDGIIIINPAEEVEGIKQEETHREYLTLEELQNVAKAHCDVDILKKAFLFSCLTGLRWSDINKLLWSEMLYSKELGNHIRFKQQKTKGAETLPISEQAREMLGEKKSFDERVFKGLKYSDWYNVKLQQWVMRAGISKTITFHCARHTYATLQLSLGTDIYTVSKLLGHRDIRTTQIYAKIIDKNKKAAANLIKIDL